MYVSENEKAISAFYIVLYKGSSPDLDSYQLIALTSLLCKMMEEIIYHILSFFLEKNHLLPQYYSFQAKQSTIDYVIRLSSDVNKAFCNKDFLCILFIDSEKL